MRAAVAARDDMLAELGLDLVIIARPLVYVCYVHMHGACMAHAWCSLQPAGCSLGRRSLT